MQSSTFTYNDQDDVEIFVYKWAPDSAPKAAVQISHGLAEHAARYERVAEALTASGYICYADDHRGHGKTAGDLNKVGILGPGGWDSTVKSLKALSDVISKENPDIPLFFLGHSLGSLFGQDYIQQWGSDLKGVIFSGSNGKQPFIVDVLGGLLTKIVRMKIGADTPSKFLNTMTFGSFNKPYEPAETDFEWLSRDPKEVKKYIDDPYCGFIATAGMGVELAYGVKKIGKEQNERKISLELPIYLLSGTDDPSNSFTKGLQALIDRYKVYGIKDLTSKFYKDARHEIFNEINRDEVIQDVINWLDSHL